MLDTSNSFFAMVVLLSLYTATAKAVSWLQYLKPVVALALDFVVGSKIIAKFFRVEIGIGVILTVVWSLLIGAIFACLLERKKKSRGSF